MRGICETQLKRMGGCLNIKDAILPSIIYEVYSRCVIKCLRSVEQITASHIKNIWNNQYVQFDDFLFYM